MHRRITNNNMVDDATASADTGTVRDGHRLTGSIVIIITFQYTDIHKIQRLYTGSKLNKLSGDIRRHPKCIIMYKTPSRMVAVLLYSTSWTRSTTVRIESLEINNTKTNRPLEFPGHMHSHPRFTNFWPLSTSTGIGIESNEFGNCEVPRIERLEFSLYLSWNARYCFFRFGGRHLVVVESINVDWRRSLVLQQWPLQKSGCNGCNFAVICSRTWDLPASNLEKTCDNSISGATTSAARFVAEAQAWMQALAATNNMEIVPDYIPSSWYIDSICRHDCVFTTFWRTGNSEENFYIKYSDGEVIYWCSLSSAELECMLSVPNIHTKKSRRESILVPTRTSAV